ncbi:MAG: hypothetical protein Q4B43_08040 [Bacteroidota bacterium]|nr:hypothetical protein [Bacteroidota bacterium]
MNRLLFVLAFVFVSCQEPKTDVLLSAYYWKTVFKISDDEQKFVVDNQINNLYVRYFDVAVEKNTPKPIAPIVFESVPIGVKIIPVIYIKNEVFLTEGLDEENLSKNIYQYINQINTKNKIQIEEIQIDCDWTLTTKDSFFKFLTFFKQLSNKVISATIRLHQVKYFEKTGVPPVDRGVLMYYNMGKLSVLEQNSIYDKEVASKYINYLHHYPLALDVALPIFEWGVVIRDGNTIDLIDNQVFNNFIQNKSVHLIKENCYQSAEQIIVNGKVFREGDIVKIEKIKPNDVKQMTKELTQAMSKLPKEIILYELSDKYIYNYEKAFFKQIF